MRNETCLFLNRDYCWPDALQQRIKPDLIKVIPINKLWAPADPNIPLNQHTAIVFTTDLLIGEPREVIYQLRHEDSQIVAIALLKHPDDKLEQELLYHGCDDVITAPFSIDTLSARLLLRIRQRGWSIGSNHIVHLNENTIDFRELKIYRKGIVDTLSRNQADLLQYFIVNANQVITRREVCETLWADHIIDLEGKNLDMQISKLRKVLNEPKDNNKRMIETVRGVGYRFNQPKPSNQVYTDRISLENYLASQSMNKISKTKPNAPINYYQKNI